MVVEEAGASIQAAEAGPAEDPIRLLQPGTEVRLISVRAAGLRPGQVTVIPGPAAMSRAGNQRYGNSYSAPAAVADGRWHSFASQGGGRGASGAQSAAGPASNAGGFHVFSGNRQAGSAGTVRSFSGQGGEVWENSPAAQNVVPRSQSLATLHNSFSGSAAAGTGLRSNSALSSSARVAGGSALVGNRGFSGGVNSATSFQQLRGGFNRFGGNSFGGFGRGCWNCGFGFGRFGGWGFGWGGWGFGWPWLGFGLWDPFWVDPWWGSPAPGYGYYGYPDSSVYGYPDPGYSYQNDNSNPPQEQENQEPLDGNWVTPNGPSPSAAQNSANLAVPVLIFMKSGAVYTVRDYWITDEELYYVLMNGVQHSVDLQQVDLPRTNTENAKSGVKFIFKSEPSITVPAQPNAEPGSPNEPAPAPTQQIRALPQPEART